MFIWDFVADTVLGQIIDWIYGQNDIDGFREEFLWAGVHLKMLKNI